MTEKPTKKKGSKAPGIIIIVILSVFVAAGWAFILYADVQVDEGSYGILAADYPSNMSIVVIDEIDNFAVDIKVSDQNSPYIFKVDWKMYQTVMGDRQNPLQMQIVNSTFNDTLNIKVDILNEENFEWNFGFFDSAITILINPKYIINFTANCDSASLDFETNNATFGLLNIYQNSGSLDFDAAYLTVNNSVMLENDYGSQTVKIENGFINGSFVMTGESGSRTVNLKNFTVEQILNFQSQSGAIDIALDTIRFIKNGTVYTKCESGSITLNWTETHAIGRNVSIQAMQGSGSVTITLNIPLTIARHSVYATADSGSITIGGSSKTSPGIYKSSNFDNENFDLIYSYVKTSSGSITVGVPTA